MRMVKPKQEEHKVKIIDKNILKETGETKNLKDLNKGDVYQMIKGNQSIREVESIESFMSNCSIKP